MSGKLLPALALALALASCASVDAQRGKDVSSAGIRYTQTAAALVDAAIDSAVDTDSAAKLAGKARRGSNARPREDQLEAELVQSDDALILTVTRYQQVRMSLAMLEAYFTALQNLARGAQGEASSVAVKSLADSINVVDAVLSEDKTLALSAAQKSAAAGLAGLVADDVHGTVVAAALRRDAPTIGRMLAISEKAVLLAEQDVRDYLVMQNNVLYQEKVLGPYKKQSMPESWVASRRTYLKVAALGRSSAPIDKADAAATQMQTAWEKILSGDYGAGELNKMVGNTERLLDAMMALRDAPQPKSAIAASPAAAPSP